MVSSLEPLPLDWLDLGARDSARSARLLWLRPDALGRLAYAADFLNVHDQPPTWNCPRRIPLESPFFCTRAIACGC